MHEAYEYVQNISGRPIPMPVKFTPEENRKLVDCQRRAHLESFDEKKQRMPLNDDERAWLAEQEDKILNSRLICYGGQELPFAIDQIYQVPRGAAARIVAQNPARLRKLTWSQVRVLEGHITEVHFQTEQEAKELAVAVGGDDSSLSGSVPVVEMKDGLVRLGEGAWQPITARG